MGLELMCLSLPLLPCFPYSHMAPQDAGTMLTGGVHSAPTIDYPLLYASVWITVLNTLASLVFPLRGPSWW
jgi:hypothetical protein